MMCFMFTWTDLGIALSESHTNESIMAECTLGSLCLWQSPTVVIIVAVPLDPNDRNQMWNRTAAESASKYWMFHKCTGYREQASHKENSCSPLKNNL